MNPNVRFLGEVMARQSCFKINWPLVYDASKLSTVYVVKWPVLGLQRAPENSEFAPSV